jgi:serine/threonine-protein kinase
MSSTALFLDALRASRLLSPARWEELTRHVQPRFLQLRQLARHLIEEEWLTPYQINQLLLGRGQNLVLGSYVVLDRLGTGSVAQVFKAEHRHMNRLVALKILHENVLVHPRAVHQFYREVEAVGQLSHPNLIHAYDAGPLGESHYLAVEYVNGTDLKRVVKHSGMLSQEQACDFIRQAALGLHHAYEHGLLHHDLRPSNLFVTQQAGLSFQTVPDGDSGPFQATASALQSARVKIHNIGLTFQLPSFGSGQGLDSEDQGIEAWQSLDYLAPERVANLYTTDVRASLYSLGCVFYYLLTGQVPFPGGSPLEKARQHQCEEPVPIEFLCTDVAPEVSAVVSRLMAKRAQDRWQTPLDVAAALKEFCPAEACVAGLRK